MSSRKRSRSNPTTPEAVTRAAAPGIAPATIRAIFLAAIALAVIAIYAQTVHHTFINFDDNLVITENPVVKQGLSISGARYAFTTFTTANWIPLTWLSHMAAVNVFGSSSAGPHILINVALHILACIFLFLFLEAATGASVKSGIVSLLLAVHPLRVESVAWVAERKDVLSAAFWMAACLAYVHYARQPRFSRYALVVLLFALGLLAKPMLVTLPLILFVLDYWPLRRLTDFRSIRTAVVEKIPLLVLSAAGGVATLLAQREAMSNVTAVPLLERLANAATSYVAYIATTILPRNLAVIYPLSGIDARSAVLAVVVVVAVTVFAVLFRDRMPYLLSGWSWYLISLLPVIGIIQVGVQARADRYTYIPSVGILVAIIWAVAELPEKRAAAQRVALGVACLAAIVYASLAYRQVSYWRDSVTLFERTLAVTTDNADAEAVLAQAYADRGDRTRAIDHYTRAVELDPSFQEARADLQRLAGSADPEASVESWRKLADASPLDPDAHFQLGRALLRAGRTEAAAPELAKAVELGSSLPVKTKNRYAAFSAAAAGNTGEAERMFRASDAPAAEAATTLTNAGVTLEERGAIVDAIDAYRAALTFDPRSFDAQMNLGTALSRIERDAEAITAFQNASRLRPTSAEPRIYLALALTNAGRIAEAIVETEQAQRIDSVESNRVLTSSLRLKESPGNLQAFLDELRSRRPRP